jgi:hypothetical protein
MNQELMGMSQAFDNLRRTVTVMAAASCHFPEVSFRPALIALACFRKQPARVLLADIAIVCIGTDPQVDWAMEMVSLMGC